MTDQQKRIDQRLSAQGDEDLIASQAKEIEELKAQVKKLQDFKDYTHKRLDDSGVPIDPDSPHKEKGCRIGGRLDFVDSEITRLKSINEAAEKVIEVMRLGITVRTYENSPKLKEVFDTYESLKKKP